MAQRVARLDDVELTALAATAPDDASTDLMQDATPDEGDADTRSAYPQAIRGDPPVGSAGYTVSLSLLLTESV